MYRTIAASFWTDPKVKKLSPNDKLLFLYLITNPHTHVSGIYHLDLKYAATDLGYPMNTLSRSLDTLSSAGLCAYDESTEVIWVKKMMGYQGRGDKNVRSAAHHIREDLHHSVLIREFLTEYPGVAALIPDTLLIGYPEKSVGATPGTRSLVPDPEQDQEQEQEKKPSSAGADRKRPQYTPEFESFWTASTKRGSKVEAYREWAKLKPIPPDLDRDIHQGMLAWKASEQWQDETKQPHVFRWLRRRGWEELVPRSSLFGGSNGTHSGNSGHNSRPATGGTGQAGLVPRPYTPKQR